MAKKKKTLLESYLDKPLPPFARGSADCCAWVGAYINSLTGEESVKCKAMTFGDAVREIQTHGDLSSLVKSRLKGEPFKSFEKPEDGDIVVYSCGSAISGQALGIYKDGSVVTRMESQSLHLTQDPEIALCLRLTQS